MHWRKAWAAHWEEVRFCSAACRKNRPGETDTQLEQMIISLLDQRSAGASICPSEVARAVKPNDWEELMEPTRCAARRLVALGVVEITQRGSVVEPSTARGPIRIRLVQIVAEPELVARKGKK
jgi:Protein of unknown function (DUF3253)/Uncharacterized protein conserved in bacteria (DUF2256)